MTATADPSIKESKNLGALKDRLKQLATTGKLIPFLDRKLRKTWSECWISLYYVIDNSQNYGTAYNFLAGKKSLLFRSYYQLSLAVIYLTVLLMSLFRVKSGKQDVFLLLSLSFLGGALFHLIWEANGFYSISFLYLAVMIGAMLMAELSEYSIINNTNNVLLQNGRSEKVTGIVNRRICRLLTIILFVVFGASVIKTLSYQVVDTDHSGWSVNSNMRRPDLEYEIDSLGKSVQDLKQEFEVPDGRRINIIELLVEITGNGDPGYLFTLYQEDGEELYSKILNSSSFPGVKYAEAAYHTIILPKEIGAGKYYFRIMLNGPYDPLKPGYEEYLSFYCRSYLGTNYNPYGELLVNGKVPEEGRSNLVFNAYYIESSELDGRD